ncbi:hypothetical protein L6241_02445 [Janibacter sp. Y6]|uniref:PGN_0703 family putative restriction endonuclease n=1 Tax=Janibacter sp. Y6 TaxID=2913552 RepID=UPI0034A2ABE0
MVANDMKKTQFKAEHEALAAAWKKRSNTLTEEARASAPWINQDGQPRGRYDHCLPAGFAAHNLLPHVRRGAIQLFIELGIPWHAGIDNGPGNNLLSSQVQCVNALYPMVSQPLKIKSAFGHLVDIGAVLEIERGRFLTFEYIGPTDYFNEGKGRERIRGSRCTSVDAAFRYRTSTGRIEIALVEWKYTEAYLEAVEPPPGYNKTREARYGVDLEAVDGPVRMDLVDLDFLFDEPLYQLMRQQLLAYRLEQDRVLEADVVRVLHVLDPANAGYQQSLVRSETKALGDKVDEVWSRLLRNPDRFAHVDPAVFLDPAVTSSEYVDRYSLRLGS